LADQTKLFRIPSRSRKRGGAVYGALYDVRGFVGAQAHPVELCRAGRDSQADGEDTLSAPVPLRRAHSVEPGSSFRLGPLAHLGERLVRNQGDTLSPSFNRAET
jgi:hypothetical protein